MTYNQVWDETYPPGSLSADQINEAIQYWAKAIRERMNDVLGITDWATAIQPITFGNIKFRGATPGIQGGTSSLNFIDSTGVFNNGIINDSGDYTSRRHLISAVNLISNTNLVFNANSAKVLPGSVSLLFRDFLDANTNVSITDIGDVSVRRDFSIGRNTSFNGNALFSTGQGSLNRFNAGNSGAALSVDFNNGNNQLITLTGNCTLTLTNPVVGSVYVLELLQDGTGSRLVTFPGSVKWPSAAAPTLSTGVNKTDIVTLYYNGTNYLAGTGGFNY